MGIFLSPNTVEGGFDRVRLFHALLLCFFLPKESKALDRIIIFCKGFPTLQFEPLFLEPLDTEYKLVLSDIIGNCLL